MEVGINNKYSSYFIQTLNSKNGNTDENGKCGFNIGFEERIPRETSKIYIVLVPILMYQTIFMCIIYRSAWNKKH